MNGARICLGICALTFFGLGLLLMWNPAPILAKVDLTFTTPTAIADIRADYGGCIFGLSLFMGWCALRPDRVNFGLLCCGLTLSGYALGRIIAIVIDGTPKQIIFILLAVEIVGAAVCFYFARKSAKLIESKPI